MSRVLWSVELRWLETIGSAACKKERLRGAVAAREESAALQHTEAHVQQIGRGAPA